MKNLETTTTGSLFQHTGIMTHCGDYAGKYQDEAIEILENLSDRYSDIFDDGDGWADIMFNSKTSKAYAVWANVWLTEINALCEYVEISEEDCPAAYRDMNAQKDNN